MDWTDAQQQAISATNRELLVSAAAGAGKTAVLVERVIRKISDLRRPLDLDRLLVVTFTEAAAASMRQRLGQALLEALEARPHDSRLLRQLSLLEKAAISTIHSFCLQLIRRYFYLLDLDPSFRVADEAEAELLRWETLEQVMEEEYGRHLGELAQRYGGSRGDENLERLILRLYSYSASHPDPEAWLARQKEAYRLDSEASIERLPWYLEFRQAVNDELGRAVLRLQQALTLSGHPSGPAAYASVLEQDLAGLEALGGVSNWDDFYRRLEDWSWGRLPRVQVEDEEERELKELTQKLRDQAKGIVNRLKAWAARPGAELLEEVRAVGPWVEALADMVLNFARAYAQAKRERNLVDFNDLEHFCLRLLSTQAVLAELREQYQEVLVDEYQDINPVQDRILGLVCGGNLFMVGDVKQSIYRFRLAEPRLFMEKYRTYAGEREAPQRRIDLSANFRSSQPVIDAVNFIFRRLMAEPVAEIEYDAQAELVYGREEPGEVSGSTGPESGIQGVEVHLIERSMDTAVGADAAEGAAQGGAGANFESDSLGPAGTEPEELALEEIEAPEMEARVVAQRILELRAEHPGLRYADMAVLMRSTYHRANQFMEVFHQMGIPAYAELGTGYFDAVEVQTFLSLLRLIDNPRQDIPLVAVLRSPLMGLRAKELAQIRLADPEGDYYDAVVASARGSSGLAQTLQSFLQQLDGWRTAARRQPLPDVIASIYRETGYYDYVGGLAGGPQRQANLRALYYRARQFESFARRGLFRFLRFIERLRETDTDLGPAKVLGENEDVVRLMSIHKSKGLEFPVVFVADLGKQFNWEDIRGDLLAHRELGLGPMLVNLDLRVKYPTLPYRAIGHRLKREQIAEEMRILYVALTRARERLILVGSRQDLLKAWEQWQYLREQTGDCQEVKLPAELLLGARGYLDWIGPALAGQEEGDAVADDAFPGSLCFWNVQEGRPIPKLPGEEAQPLPPENGAGIEALGDRTREETGSAQLAGGQPEWDQAPGPVGGDGSQDLGPEARAWREELERRFNWSYAYAELAGLPAKMSASAIRDRERQAQERAASQDELLSDDLPGAELPGAGAGGGTAGTAGTPGGSELLVQPGQSPAAPGDWPRGFRRPRFLTSGDGQLTAVERGTLTHLVLQHLDLKGRLDQQGINAQIQGMVRRELLTSEEAKVVQVGAIATFFAHPLGQRLAQNWHQVEREVPFSLGLPLREVFPDLILDAGIGASERVLVQGVIDCLLRVEGGFLLLDFKTDRVTQATLAEVSRGYFPQIEVYRKAVERIYQRPVLEAYLYFLTLGRAVPVPKPHRD